GTWASRSVFECRTGGCVRDLKDREGAPRTHGRVGLFYKWGVEFLYTATFSKLSKELGAWCASCYQTTATCVQRLDGVAERVNSVMRKKLKSALAAFAFVVAASLPSLGSA